MAASVKTGKKFYCQKCGRFLFRMGVLKTENVEKAVVVVEIDTRCVKCGKDRLYIVEPIGVKEL